MEIVEWKDHEDGGATVTFDLTYDEIVIFAKIGIETAIKESVEKVLKNEGFYRTISELDRPVSDS